MQETDRRMQETDQLLGRQARAADQRMDKLEELFNGQWGKLMESLAEGDLAGRLRQRGIAVQHTVTNRGRTTVSGAGSSTSWPTLHIIRINNSQTGQKYVRIM